MSKINNESIKTHSIGFADSKFNELPFAKQTSDHFKTTHHEYIVDIESKEVLKKLAWYFDEPFADSSSLPTYYVSKMTRQNVTVALSGDGGDENFAGYSKYSQDLKEYAIRNSIPGFIRNLVLKPLAEIYPKNDTFPSLFRLKSVLTSIAETDAWGAYNSLSHCSEQLRNELIHPDITCIERI
jgi:asparagine synthase (glutamine-hydrolysing)